MHLARRPLALLGGTPRFGPHHFPLDRVDIAETAIDLMSKTLASGQFSMFTSTEIESFEKEFASYLGVDHCILVNSCTNAILACFSAFDLINGAKVAAPAFTYVGSCMPGTLLDVDFVWIDCDARTAIIDPQNLEKQTGGMDLAGVIVPLLFGDAGPYEELIEFSRRREVPIIFDCAQFMDSRGLVTRLANAGPCCFSFGDSVRRDFHSKYRRS